MPVKDGNGGSSVKQKPRKVPLALGLGAGVVVLGYVGVAAALAGNIPNGATLAGVEIGGLTPQAAITKLNADLGEAMRKPFNVTLAGKTATIDPVTAGLAPDFSTTVHAVTDFTLNPVALGRQLFGTKELELSSKIDEKKLAAALDAAGKELKTAPAEANFLCNNGNLEAVQPAAGKEIDPGGARDYLEENWWRGASTGKSLELPGEVSEPKSTAAQLQHAQQGVAKTLVSGPVRLDFSGQALEVPVAQLCQNAKWELKDGELQPVMDGEKLREFALSSLPNLEVTPVNASFNFDSGAPVVVEAVDGSVLKPEEIQAKVQAAATSVTQREAQVQLEVKAPDFTTEAARKAGVKEVIGEFSTPLTADEVRTGNLVQGAARISGLIYAPGDTFSLEKALGPITVENGWVPSMVIQDGKHMMGLGGGLSQVSTTMMNAAWFAGMDLVEFTPHSEWFSRYPAGRESTLWEGSIDMKWKNPTPNYVVVQSWVGGGAFHVRLWGTKYYDVKSIEGPRTGYTYPKVVEDSSPNCKPSDGGTPGFTVTNTRIRYLNGVEHDRKTYTHTYSRPHPKVVCTNQKSEGQQAEGQHAEGQH